MVVFATYTLYLVRLRLTAKLKLAKHFLLLIELFSTFSSISFVQIVNSNIFLSSIQREA